MEIIGIGVDIEAIERFKKLPFENNKSFYEKVFTEKEIFYCLEREDSSACFTGKFSAKEAFIKASQKIPQDYKAIEIILDENKKPFIKTKSGKVFLSISHSQNQAIAFLILAK